MGSNPIAGILIFNKTRSYDMIDVDELKSAFDKMHEYIVRTYGNEFDVYYDSVDFLISIKNKEIEIPAGIITFQAKVFPFSRKLSTRMSFRNCTLSMNDYPRLEPIAKLIQSVEYINFYMQQNFDSKFNQTTPKENNS
jgi:hypothetical protein